MLRRKRHSAKGKPLAPNALVPNFCQSVFRAVRGGRGGHQKYSQSYQWTTLSAASAYGGGSAARRVRAAQPPSSRKFEPLTPQPPLIATVSPAGPRYGTRDKRGVVLQHSV